MADSGLTHYTTKLAAKLKLKPYPSCKCFPTLRTDEGRRDKVGVVIALEVHVEQLLLAEGLVAVAAGVRLLSSVGAFVHDHVPLLQHIRGRGKSLRVWGHRHMQATLNPKDANSISTRVQNHVPQF